MSKGNTGILAIDAAVNAGKLRRPKMRMRRFEIHEISAVDQPAQEGALMTLMKSNSDPELTEFNKWMGDGAKVVSPDDAEHITLELKGERRTFFKTEPAKHLPEPVVTKFAEECARVAVLMREPPLNPADLAPEQREKLHKFMEAHDRRTGQLLTKFGGSTAGGSTMSKHDDELMKTIAKQLEAKDAADPAPTEAEKRAAAIVAQVRQEQAEEADDKAALSFETHINEVKKRDGCSATEAMERAAMEFPKEYEEWQTGAALP